MTTHQHRRLLVTLAIAGFATCFASASNAACAFRIDGAPAPGSAAIDGLLLLRYATGARDAALVANVGGGITASAVANHVAQQRASLDVNGDGDFDVTDALIITRHLLGLRGSALLQQPFSVTGPPPRRPTGDAAQLYIDLGCPAGLQVALLGAPKLAPVNGLATVLDAGHRVARHALDAVFEPVPGYFASAPMVAPLKTLVRRDSLIVYLPNVQGAADYRVYVEGRNVLACAGYRQRASVARLDGNDRVIRELLQTVELPGLVTPGSYRVIVEALDRPCAFTGMPAHTSAVIPVTSGLLLPGLTGGGVPLRGFADAIAQYGAEIINGQGASSDWIVQTGQLRAQAVVAGSAAATPVVIARSAIRVLTPFADEGVNAPIIDVGPNAVFDDFSTDAVASFGRIASRSFGGSDAIQGPFGNWYFWGASAQAALGQSATDPPLGVQVWRRHGRLNITLADWAQDVFSAVHFSSLQSKPAALQSIDPTHYAHSFFRVDSGATGRRYWHWMMCGGADVNTLVDPATNIPRIRPLLRPDFFLANGVNPTEPAGGNEPLTPYHRRECLNVFHRATGNPDTPRLPDGSDGPRPNQELIVTVNPEGRARGVINLAPAVFDRGYGENAFRWRLDAAGRYAGPLIEPFDQQQPLTHYDIFMRKDRVVIFVNGRQGACIDLSSRPLAMNYGLIVYGQVLYHSDAEYGEYYVPERPASNPYQAPYGSFHLSMNTVAADSRAWDAVGHSEKIAIPPLFSFDPALCRPPGNVAIQ